ncbi:DsbA family protein [Enterobacter asburiae]|nr:DsbA family protein [Enterobacter asburiae]
MLKALLVMSVLLPQFSYAQDYVAGKDYFIVEHPVTQAPRVVEFISFNCSHCYYYEIDSDLNRYIKSSLPQGIAFTQYHTSRINPLGPELTRAWAVAQVLGITEQVKPKLFNAIQKSHTVHSVDDIQELLTDKDHPLNVIRKAWNADKVSASVSTQNSLTESLDLHSVPSIYINGKYRINNAAFTSMDENTVKKQYVALVKYLLNKPD